MTQISQCRMTYEMIYVGGDAMIEDMISKALKYVPGDQPVWVVMIEPDGQFQAVKMTVYSDFTDEYPISRMLRKSISHLYRSVTGREPKR